MIKMIEQRDEEKEKRVEKALKIMRKANIKLSHLDKEIAKLDSKKKKSNHSNVKKREGKGGLTDEVYEERIPTKFKTIDQMQIDARANYALHQELTLYRSKITRVNPRSIHPELIEEIKLEEVDKRRAKALQKRALRSIKRKSLDEKCSPPDRSDADLDLENITSNDAVQDDVAIQIGDCQILDQNENLIGPTTPTRQTPPLTGHCQLSFTPVGIKGLLAASPGAVIRMRPASAGIVSPSPWSRLPWTESDKDSDKPLFRAQELREQYLAREYEEAQLRAMQRERRLEERHEQAEREQRQRALLVVVTALTWLNKLFQRPIVANVMKAKLELKLLTAKKAFIIPADKAVQKLIAWWRLKSVRLKLQRFPWVTFILRGAVRRFLAKSKIHKLKEAASLITRFIKDSYGISQTMSHIYSFRKQVKIIQRYARNWILIQHARLELLYLAREKIEKRRRKLEMEEKIQHLRQALRALSQMDGFAETMTSLDRSKKSMRDLLEKEQQIIRKELWRQQRDKQKYEEQRRRDEALPMGHLLAIPRPGYMMSTPSMAASVASSSAPPEGSTVSDSAACGGAGGAGSSAIKSRVSSKHAAVSATKAVWDFKPGSNKALGIEGVGPRSWIRKIAAKEPHKLRLLRAALKQERRRHLIQIDSLLKKRTAPGGQRVDVRDLRMFLRDPQHLAGIEHLYIALDDGKQETYRRPPKPPFYLMTKGALDTLEGIPSALYAKKPAPPKTTQAGSSLEIG